MKSDGNYDFNVPDNISTLDGAKETLERVPGIIPLLEEELSRAMDELANLEAQITLENKNEKAVIIKSIIQIDERVKVQKEEVWKWRTVLLRWREARDSAKKFYNSYT